MIKSDPLKLIDKLPFHIALEIRYLGTGIFASKRFQELFKRLVAVYVRFPPAQQIQIGAVDDRDLHDPNINQIKKLPKSAASRIR